MLSHCFQLLHSLLLWRVFVTAFLIFLILVCYFCDLNVWVGSCPSEVLFSPLWLLRVFTEYSLDSHIGTVAVVVNWTIKHSDVLLVIEAFKELIIIIFILFSIDIGSLFIWYWWSIILEKIHLKLFFLILWDLLRRLALIVFMSLLWFHSA